MKTILTVIFVLATAGMASAEVTYKAANQVTVAADEPTTLITGDPIPSSDILTYKWFYDIPGGDVTPIPIDGDTDEPVKTITFAEEGAYHIGVAAIRHPEGTTAIITGEIAWSDDVNVALNGEAWGILYYSPTGKVTSFGVQ